MTEVGVDTYALTPYATALAEEQFPSLYTFLYEMNQPCFANYPKFAAETKYENPTDPAFSNFQSWKGKDQTLFTMLGAKPEIGVHFNNTMGVYAGVKTAWVDVYPSDSIVAAAKPDTPLVVDVGGGIGHDLEKFRAKHPDVANGSLVLQDLPNVVATAQLKAPATAQAYDFFTPEPIKSARAYYLHCVLHDWPDVKAVEILKNLSASMEKNYSRILLHENVITPEHAHPRASLSDIVMMMSFSAVERTEEMWHELVSQAGLKISKIWTAPESVESIIEIELP